MLQAIKAPAPHAHHSPDRQHRHRRDRQPDDVDPHAVTVEAGFDSYVGDASAAGHYLRDGEIVPRPTLAFDKTAIAADGEDLATLAAPLPPGAIVEIDGARVEVDGALQIASDMPATYRVEIDGFPYRFFSAEITAT